MVACGGGKRLRKHVFLVCANEMRDQEKAGTELDRCLLFEETTGTAFLLEQL
jgi:hypothetical protein